MATYNTTPVNVVEGRYKKIAQFNVSDENIDKSVVEAFGEEWAKFYNFSDTEITQLGDEYFDILPATLLNKQSIVLDVGCGTGRWTKYLADKVQFVEAIDPSKAIFYANELLKDVKNVRLSMASTDNIPFNDNTFDLVMSIGVLHHIPDTKKAMIDCVKKVKSGGCFYVYLYYALDDKGIFFKSLFWVTDFLRKGISNLDSFYKKIICDILAFTIYLPLVMLGRFFKVLGLKKLANALPLSYYQEKSLFVMRNDALDRFGTKLEQRFTKKQVVEMMEKAGLTNICVSDSAPYWHAIGQKL